MSYLVTARSIVSTEAMQRARTGVLKAGADGRVQFRMDGLIHEHPYTTGPWPWGPWTYMRFSHPKLLTMQ